jgi:hypothetical protein
MGELNFICPYMRISLKKACGVISCPYHASTILSQCVWAYINSKKTITPTELAVVLGKNPTEIENILKQIKIKLAITKLKRYLNTRPIKLHYCYKCGRAFDLKKKGDHYICISHCKKINIFQNIENVYNKPISHILMMFAFTINTNMIANLLQYSNKNVKDTFIKIFGDSSLLSKFKDAKEAKILKNRTKKLKLRSLSKIPKGISFNTLARKVKNF